MWLLIINSIKSFTFNNKYVLIVSLNNFNLNPICLSIPPSTSFASTENEISFVSVDEKNDDLFMEFTDSEREYIMKIPAASNHQDLAMLARLRKKGEIVYCELKMNFFLHIFMYTHAYSYSIS